MASTIHVAISECTNGSFTFYTEIVDPSAIILVTFYC